MVANLLPRTRPPRGEGPGGGGGESFGEASGAREVGAGEGGAGEDSDMVRSQKSDDRERAPVGNFCGGEVKPSMGHQKLFQGKVFFL